MVGLKRTPQDLIANFGVVSGVWIEENVCSTSPNSPKNPPSTMPRPTCACPVLPEDEYLTVFGQYVIKPESIRLPGTANHNNIRERGEFQLTSALDRLRQIDGFNGLVIDGRRFDIGIPEYYLKTLQAFAEP